VKTQSGVYQPEGSGERKGEPPTGGSGIMPAVTVDIPMPKGAAVPRSAHTVQVAQAQFSPFVTALIDAGIVPDNCKRVVIDCNTGKAIVIHYEVFGDERLNAAPVLDAVFELGLKVKAEAGK
jgi:hypothetical protein